MMLPIIAQPRAQLPIDGIKINVGTAPGQGDGIVHKFSISVDVRGIQVCCRDLVAVEQLVQQ
jgi:hypothetical protein